MPMDVFDGGKSHDEDKQREEQRWEHVRGRAQEAVRRASQQGRRRGSFDQLNKRQVIIAAAVLGVMIVCLVLYLILAGQRGQATSQTMAAQPGGSGAHAAGATNSQAAGPNAGQPAATVGPPAGPNSELSRAVLAAQNADHQTERWPTRLARIGLSLALAALLGAVLAFRPRRDPEARRRTPEMARTQILITMLAAGLMLVAAGDLVIALTILGAAVFIRVRPSAFDSREGTVVLVSAGVGLACGAGRWDVAIILGGFAFVVLRVLESSRQEGIARSVDLSIETRNVRETNDVLREVFDKNRMAAEFVRVDTSDPTGRTGIVHYSMNVKQDTSLDRVSEEVFSNDPDNVLSVNWQQRRWPAVAYR